MKKKPTTTQERKTADNNNNVSGGYDREICFPTLSNHACNYRVQFFQSKHLIKELTEILFTAA